MPNRTRKILVADDKASMRQLLETALEDKGFPVTVARDGAEAIALLKEQLFDIVITDLSMPKKTGMDVLKAAKEVCTDTQVILVTGYGTIDTAVEAMRLGARDFIAKPFKLAEIELKIDSIVRETDALNPELAEDEEPHAPIDHPMIAASEDTRKLLAMIKKIGPTRSSVLITGESGTGKELVARALHDASARKDMPFIALNCAALAPGVLESELFGHEKGAFSGAVDKRVGRFERADGGTLFLDEVGEIDPGVQTKLLRALQQGEFERVGGTQTIKVDVRIVAATNRDLQDAIREGRFREDFFYRLNVFGLNVAPLRKRKDDIPALIDHFLKKFSQELNKDVSNIDDTVMSFFMRYPWPGNVRELENLIERAVVMTETDTITREELPQELLFEQTAPEVTPPSGKDLSLPERSEKLESDIILEALEQFHWNKTKTAQHLGLKRTTLQYKIKKYGLE